MVTPADRLKKVRQERYDSATAAARAMGMSPPTYLGHENGTTGLRRDAALKYARFFRISLEWLLTGRGSARSINQVPVVGRVGAGAAVFPIDDHPRGLGVEMVDAPPDGEDCVAVRIEGDSLYPFLEGWLLFYNRTQDGIAEAAIGALSVVKVAGGPTLAKILRRGSKPGLWRLESHNAPPIEDVEVEWAAKVTFIKQT